MGGVDECSAPEDSFLLLKRKWVAIAIYFSLAIIGACRSPTSFPILPYFAGLLSPTPGREGVWCSVTGLFSSSSTITTFLMHGWCFGPCLGSRVFLHRPVALVIFGRRAHFIAEALARAYDAAVRVLGSLGRLRSAPSSAARRPLVLPRSSAHAPQEEPFMLMENLASITHGCKTNRSIEPSIHYQNCNVAPFLEP